MSETECSRLLLLICLFTSILLFPGVCGEGSLEFLEDSLSDDHTIQKRAESNHEPHFKTGDLVVDEFVGMVMVCVIGGLGNARRNLGIYTARGPDERCPTRPCPSATEGVDYERLFETYFEIREGERFCRNITIINDQLVEGREFFLVILEDLRWGELIETLAVVIEDEDSPTFISSSQNIREDGGSVSICIVGGITNETVAVQTQNTSNANNGATLDQDYRYVYKEISITPGEMSCVDVPIVNDTLYEGFETFEVVLSAVNGTLSNFSSSSTTVVILEDDSIPQFAAFNRFISEHDGSSSVCVTFMEDSAVTVEATLTTANSTALAGLDFEQLNVTFPIQGGEEKCFNVVIYDDTRPEPYERIVLLLNSSNNALGHLITTRLTIVDDDVLDFVKTSYTIGENRLLIPICVAIVSGVNFVINGTIRTSSNTATVGVDYFGIDATFSLGGAQQRCFNFIVINDNIPELTETVLVTVSTLSSFGQILEQRRVLVSITDDDTDLCGILQLPGNGTIVAFTNERRAGSFVIYRCNIGYQLAGISGTSRQCLLNGSWSQQDPTCEPIMCPVLADPSFGMVQMTGRMISSKALYSCFRGYRLSGDQERECLLSGMWSGNQPVCSEILCPVLPNITDGVVIIVSRSVDALAVYNCSAGFEILGIDVRVCMEDGNWNGTEPICTATIDLPMPGPVEVQLVNETPKIDRGSVLVNFMTMGPTNTVLCELGDYTVVEDFTNRTSGNMTFHDMKPGVYTLKVTASDSFTGEASTVERFFEISDHPDFCGLHLINDGLTVSGRSIHVQFAGVPTYIDTFRCKLDNKPGFDCYGVVDLDNIEPGAHRLKIMHNRDQCGPRRKLFLHFTIY